MTISKGKEMNDPKSKSQINSFVETHRLNMNEVANKPSEFKTFNEFFFRKLKPDARSEAFPGIDSVAVSPADCRMMVFNTIDDSKELWIKGENFTVSHLLDGYDQDGKIAPMFTGGSLVIARLAPQDYHRFHLPVTGYLKKRFPIGGDYNTVNPMAIRRNVDVYTTNKRTICPIETNEFGTVLLIAIAATMVGSIHFSICDCKQECSDGACVENRLVQKFTDFGYFAFGGSTTLVLFRPGAIKFDSDLSQNSLNQMETLVKVGMRIGESTPIYKKKT